MITLLYQKVVPCLGSGRLLPIWPGFQVPLALSSHTVFFDLPGEICPTETGLSQHDKQGPEQGDRDVQHRADAPGDQHWRSQDPPGGPLLSPHDGPAYRPLRAPDWGHSSVQFNRLLLGFLTSNIWVNWLFNHYIPIVGFFMADLIHQSTSFCRYLCHPLDEEKSASRPPPPPPPLTMSVLTPISSFNSLYIHSLTEQSNITSGTVPIHLFIHSYCNWDFVFSVLSILLSTILAQGTGTYTHTFHVYVHSYTS